MLSRSSTPPVNASYIRALSAAGVLHARLAATEFNYRKGVEIYGEKEPADYVYQVTSGAVRTYKLLSDGRRQIGAFHLVGDIFGLENSDVHRFTAEAIVDTALRLVKRRSLESVAEYDVLVANNLLGLTTNNLRHAEDHMLLLGRKTALERVAAFLLEMDSRLKPPRYRRLSWADAGDGFARAVQSARPGNSRLPRPESAPDRAVGSAAAC